MKTKEALIKHLKTLRNTAEITDSQYRDFMIQADSVNVSEIFNKIKKVLDK